MNANPLFSIIIPHKNRQQMLQRCLDSIPRREDVQIIVVDDNSDPKQVDFKRFPGLNESNVEVYFTNKGKGAGYARNVGLEHAKGKWILFADADDWYLDNLSITMDKYANCECDMLIFRTKRVGVNGDEVKNDFDIFFEEAIINNNYDPIKYQYVCAWGKFIKRTVIEKNKIRFQEVRYSNDVLFSLKLASCCRAIEVIDSRIYSVYESQNSLTRNSNWRSPYTRIKVSLDAYLCLKRINKEKYVEDEWIIFWNRLWKMNKMSSIIILLTKVRRVLGIKDMFSKSLYLFKINYPKYYSLLFENKQDNSISKV